MASKAKGKADVLSTLCAAVAAYYKDKGDRTQAGVVISCLDFDPTRFYASVARYPDGPHHKQIVVGVGHRPSDAYRTAESAVAALAVAWHKLVTPPPVTKTLNDLESNLELWAATGGTP